MAVQEDFLKSIPYFFDLDSTEIHSIQQLVFEKRAERGDIILLEGESAEALFFVTSGVVKIFKTSAEGKEQILNIIRPGESFNDVPIFDDGLQPASVQAMGSVILYGIRKHDLRTITTNKQQVALNVIRVLANRLRELITLVEDLSFRHVISRVAKILLEHASTEIDSAPRLTQQEIAAMAGTSREVVNRSLKALSGDGLIRLDRHRILIIDEKRINELVKASY